MKNYLKLMSRSTKLKCAGASILALVNSILASIWPVRLGNIYTAISNREIGSIYQCIWVVFTFGVIYLAAECTSIVRRVMLDCIIASHEAEIRETSIERLLKMPVSYYSSKSGGEEKLSGERTAQLNQGVSGLSQLIKIGCNDVVATVLTAICTLIQVMIKAPLIIVGIMMSYLLCTILISVFQIRSQKGIRENIITQKNALDGQVCQSITNLEFIRSMNAGDYEKNRLKPAIIKISTTEKNHHRYMGSFDCVKQFCKVAFQVIVLLTSVVMISSGKMNAGTVITVCLLFQQLIKPIDEVYRFMDEMASSVLKAKVLVEVAAESMDSVFSIETVKKEDLKKNIILENVLITDPSGENDIASYDYVYIPTDSITGIVGESGCGKTTLMRCLNRYYPFSEGRISLFGSDINSYSQKDLTDALMYFPQKSHFFAGSISSNLTYGLSRKVTDEEMIEALRKACLYDSLATKVGKEIGNNTILCEKKVLAYSIGEGGSGLSGGEGQRLSLARAFLRTPKVFIFDESTTGLDDTTVEKVLDHMEEYAKSIGAGVIYVSHDERVVKRCKSVIKLHNKLKNRLETKAA